MAPKKKSGPSAGDVTGKRMAAKQAEQAAVAAERQEELTMVNQQIQIENETAVFDPKSGAKLAEDGDTLDIPDASAGDEVIDLGVTTVEDDEVIIRINEKLTNVTIGRGTFYNFDQGKKYRVPRHVAQHLDEKGYVWH